MLVIAHAKQVGLDVMMLLAQIVNDILIWQVTDAGLTGFNKSNWFKFLQSCKTGNGLQPTLICAITSTST